MSTARAFTPLRYPGGKGKLAPFIKQILISNKLIDGHYIEPFAGGAGIAIDLLLSGYVYDIHLNDIDPGVHAFWYTVKHKPEDLCKKLLNSKITVNAWKRHRTVKNSIKDPFSTDLGFSFLFLNRTNRSGIISGGVIGGLDQTGNYKIDARFNRNELVRRIEKISYFSNHIHIYNQDAIQFLDYIEDTVPIKSLVYLDPPYYNKGSCLYQNFYKDADHVQLSKKISTLNRNWIVSYDNVPEIRQLYKTHASRDYSIQYSASKPSKGSEIMYFNKSLLIPAM